MAKIKLELEESYEEKFDILREVFVWKDGKQAENNGELVQELVDTFLEFLQNQATENNEHSHWQSWECCGWGSCSSH